MVIQATLLVVFSAQTYIIVHGTGFNVHHPQLVYDQTIPYCVMWERGPINLCGLLYRFHDITKIRIIVVLFFSILLGWISFT